MKNFHVECFDVRGLDCLPKGVQAVVYTDISEIAREADATANRLCLQPPSYIVATEFTDVTSRS